MEDVFLRGMMGSGTISTKAVLAELFNPALVEPGLVPCVDRQHPDGSQAEWNAAQRCIAGGVARKP